jgi:hypothetical protein
VSVGGVNYEVDPDLAGETVILWWGIFDDELYVEHGDKRFGPYVPVGGPIPWIGNKADPPGLPRESLGRASQCETAQDQIVPERRTCPRPNPGIAERTAGGGNPALAGAC